MPSESRAVQGKFYVHRLEHVILAWPIEITILIGKPRDTELTNKIGHW